MDHVGSGWLATQLPVVLAVTLGPSSLLRTFGTLGLVAIIFAESGLLIGFFLPGDSLLFTAGIFAAAGRLNLAVILIGCALGAVAGDQVGYLFGRKVGPSLFARPNSRLFKQEYVTRAREYLDRRGAHTIVLARFIPVVRTFAPIVAGVSAMRYRIFVAFNVAGGVLWACGVILLGWFAGDSIPNVDHYLLPIVAVIVVLSLIPAALEYRRHKRARVNPRS